MNIKEISQSIIEMRKTAPDSVAIKAKELYPQLPFGEAVTQEMIDEGNNRFLWEGRLVKVTKPIPQILDNWTPDLAPALYEEIDEEHKGTEADPIPFVKNMRVYKDKVYSYNEVLYLCTRDSGNPLQDTPNNLIKIYFEIYNPEEKEA